MVKTANYNKLTAVFTIKKRGIIFCFFIFFNTFVEAAQPPFVENAPKIKEINIAILVGGIPLFCENFSQNISDGIKILTNSVFYIPAFSKKMVENVAEFHPSAARVAMRCLYLAYAILSKKALTSCSSFVFLYSTVNFITSPNFDTML